MTKKEIAAIVVSIAVVVTLLFSLNVIYPDEPFRCKDGWGSPSIGRQGACSHHGGVVGGESTVPWYLAVVSFLAGPATLFALVKIFGLFQIDHPIDRDVQMVLAAIESRRTIEFKYRKKGSSIEETRRVVPSEIKFLSPGYTPSRCVVGYCYKAKDVRTFAMSRISEMRIA